MTHGKAEHFEILIDAGAAMLLASAVSYALLQAASGLGLGASVAALSFAGSFYALRAVRPEERAFALPEIASVPRYEATADILELTEADRWQPEPADEGELLLDTEIAHFGPGSRVVRLFEPSAIPTAGELQARINRHLTGFTQPAPPDASQELYDALAELRRSLR